MVNGKTAVCSQPSFSSSGIRLKSLGAKYALRLIASFIIVGNWSQCFELSEAES